MKNICSISALIVLLTTSSLYAQQTSSFNFGVQQAKIWELAKQRTIAVAQAMPERDYQYTPTPDVKSFGQQFVHIANSMLSMNTRFIEKETYSGNEKDASTMSKAQIIAELEQAFNTIINQLNSLDEASLLEEGKSHGSFPITKWQSLLFMQDHVTNHRAKAVLYLRLNGIAPPPYGYN